MDFERLTEAALGPGRTPFAFQAHFAQADTLPSTIRGPTGLGKTATIVLGWIWRRFYASEKVRETTPRRLVYWLPMRTLVEQTTRPGFTLRVGARCRRGGENSV
jgi:CRISPR-associated endonuclease/helicase Cas3